MGCAAEAGQDLQALPQLCVPAGQGLHALCQLCGPAWGKPPAYRSVLPECPTGASYRSVSPALEPAAPKPTLSFQAWAVPLTLSHPGTLSASSDGTKGGQGHPLAAFRAVGWVFKAQALEEEGPQRMGLEDALYSPPPRSLRCSAWVPTQGGVGVLQVLLVDEAVSVLIHECECLGSEARAAVLPTRLGSAPAPCSQLLSTPD